MSLPLKVVREGNAVVGVVLDLLLDVAINCMRGIWKLRSIVFYLSNLFTKPIMFGIILKSYLSSML